MEFRKLLFVGVVLLFSCNDEKKLLNIVLPEDSGITFSNTIIDSDTFNIMTDEYIYNGGGVGIGDFNKDGLPDIFFTGNMAGNGLFINKGNLKFEDISETAGIKALDHWNTGLAVIDINQDGWQDIYVCASLLKDSLARTNQLFVNQGLDANGNPTFVDMAHQYGIADAGHSTYAAFFDYDNDGDLDLYILNNTRQNLSGATFRAQFRDGSSINNDKLYRNNGNNTFAEVTKEAGILVEGYGLGLAIFDVNKDGARDILVSNDYITNDILYVNDGKGHYTDKIDVALRHQSKFSMGNDVGDINNDGLADIVTLDMMPETNMRKKTVAGETGYLTYINDQKFGYTHQYVRNMLHLNNGDMYFSEIGQLAGVYQTEWSWAPLLADFDNDGFKDLAVTNGFPKDVTDRDFINFRNQSGIYAEPAYLLAQIPSVKIPNYLLRNNGDLTFSDVSSAWGFTTPSFSNGAAMVDLDNDGDLDFIVNNINDVALLYENTLYDDDDRKVHYLRIKPEGPLHNRSGLGAKATLYFEDGTLQYQELSPYRGFLSTVEDFLHFGLGTREVVQKVEIVWPDGKITVLDNVPVDQVLTIKYEGAIDHLKEDLEEKNNDLFQEANSETDLLFIHEEDDFVDYNIQKNLPHKFSQYGPSLAVGDLNSDGLDDFFLGGSNGFETSVFFQDTLGRFKGKGSTRDMSNRFEDMGVLLFDADNDQDLDAYVVSGGFEHNAGSVYYQDRLYLNDGKGLFEPDKDALPEMITSGSSARAADFDKDGDLDLFVGGRVEPGNYPRQPESYILRNENGKFVNITNDVCPTLKSLGMVTDAIWSDFNNDGLTDLIVVGEFLPVTFFKNTGKTFERQVNTGINEWKGWWNSITSGDFDKDGDTDYIAGNLGRNNFYNVAWDRPLRITAKDFDNNDRMDLVMSCYSKDEFGEMRPFPIHYWDEMKSVSPLFENRFSSYKEYGSLTVDEMFTPTELNGAIVLEANYLSTSYIRNNGDGTFEMIALPVETQFAPVNGMVTADINADGNLDVVLVGNDYGNEINMGQYDALTGIVLLGNGQGEFTVRSSTRSGFFVGGDAKALVTMIGSKGDLMLLASQNRGPLKVFKTKEKTGRVLRAQPLDCSVVLTYEDGRNEKVELPYGSGFLSQSARAIIIHPSVIKYTVTDVKGNTRTIDLSVVK